VNLSARPHPKPAGLLCILTVILMQGCNQEPNILKGISLEPGQTIALDTPLKFILNGSGRCQTLNLDWGDGTTEQNYSYGTGGFAIDLSGSDASAVASRTLTKTFTGWAGGKTVTVQAASGCEGSARTRFTIEPAVYKLGFAQPGPLTCNPIPNRPALVARTLVGIKTVPATGAPNGINFGCPFNGCIYDADGKPNSSAPSNFPFPGLREYSLVFRVGTQVVQGGTNMSFTTTVPGALEVCVNDDTLANNSLGYEVDITVDQLGP
jgi:hypothetical protein